MRMRGKLPIFSKKDCWNLDNTLAVIICAGLKKFKEGNLNSYPHGYLSIEEWHETIDKMIWSFEQASSYSGGPTMEEYGMPELTIEMITGDQQIDWDCEGYRKAVAGYNGKVQEGIDLFAKYFRNLWD